MILDFIKKIFISLLIFVIRCYQLVVSPILKTNCRFLPTCSEYAIISLKDHGIFRGSYLSLKRILKCHPLGGEGYDPVPQNSKKEI
tara:strand:+ start:273 stop:530 length:258 start_codon:yes stop_codon:yes gene_type:complete